MSSAFKRHYDPHSYFRRRYPKAAKRRRIQKKWKARFGTTIREQVQGLEGYSLFARARGKNFNGGTYCVPFAFGLPPQIEGIIV